MILHGCALDRLKEFPDSYFHSVVCDPPYGLSFMGKKWDYDVPSVELWREVLRVLKPGGHMLAACGTRTQHRMVLNIEDAGFEIRDVITHLYGSGFPKSQDISKAIDKQAGAKREVIGPGRRHPSAEFGGEKYGEFAGGVPPITAPATDAAKKWQGWGTALKPAAEFWTLCRKPIEKGLTVAANVMKHGTGGMNIEASRITSDEKLARPFNEAKNAILGKYEKFGNPVEPIGRWPANLILNEEAAAVLDEQSGTSDARGGKPKQKSEEPGQIAFAATGGEKIVRNDSGGASRFFYVAKASKSERNAGLEGMPEKKSDTAYRNRVCSKCGRNELQTKIDRRCLCSDPAWSDARIHGSANHHPTVKPIKLMQYLIKLVTPEGGIVLDPFCGSGSTGVAAKKLGFGFVGIEREVEYVEIATKRLEAVAE